MGPRLQSLEQCLDARQDTTAALGKGTRQACDIFPGEGSDTFTGRVDLILSQNIANDRTIRFPGNFDVMEIIVGVESVAHGDFERFHSGAAGIYQGSINVEEEEALGF